MYSARDSASSHETPRVPRTGVELPCPPQPRSSPSPCFSARPRQPSTRNAASNNKSIKIVVSAHMVTGYSAAYGQWAAKQQHRSFKKKSFRPRHCCVSLVAEPLSSCVERLFARDGSDPFPVEFLQRVQRRRAERSSCASVHAGGNRLHLKRVQPLFSWGEKPLGGKIVSGRWQQVFAASGADTATACGRVRTPFKVNRAHMRSIASGASHHATVADKGTASAGHAHLLVAGA
jgi:hypothetical protein